MLDKTGTLAVPREHPKNNLSQKLRMPFLCDEFSKLRFPKAARITRVTKVESLHASFLVDFKFGGVHNFNLRVGKFVRYIGSRALTTQIQSRLTGDSSKLFPLCVNGVFHVHNANLQIPNANVAN